MNCPEIVLKSKFITGTNSYENVLYLNFIVAKSILKVLLRINSDNVKLQAEVGVLELYIIKLHVRT